MAGCNPAYIGMMERGEKAASLRTIEKISKALDIPPVELFRLSHSNTCSTVQQKLREQFGYIINKTDRRSLEMLTAVLEGLADYDKQK